MPVCFSCQTQGLPNDMAARQAAYELVSAGDMDAVHAVLDACYGPGLLKGQPALNFRWGWLLQAFERHKDFSLSLCVSLCDSLSCLTSVCAVLLNFPNCRLHVAQFCQILKAGGPNTMEQVWLVSRGIDSMLAFAKHNMPRH